MSTRKQANIEQNPDDITLARPSPFRRAVAWFTIIAYVGQPLVVTAEVIADQSDASKRPTVDVTANGLPLVQIATPNAAGLSHNQYTQFNVGPEGVILNNSNATVQTQQAGFVSANPNLVNSSANIILNEVTSTNRSQLNGYTEVAGQQAEVIIANPNGITCNGCGFINTSRGVLTTGTPVIGAGGSLDAFRVTGGDIQIGSSGLNGSNLDQLDLISRSVQVNGEIWANNLNVITGTNQVSHDLQGVTVINGIANQPTVGIDVALLGGMYANKIYLVGTEAGVGVRSFGNLAAQAGDFYLNNAGLITLEGNTTASDSNNVGGNITINSDTGIINNGLLYSQQDALLTSAGGSITNSGLLSAGGNLTLDADSLNSTGALGAGIDVFGNAMQNGNLSITTKNGTVVSGVNMSGGSMSIKATDINLTNSKTNAWSGITLEATAGNIDLTKAQTQSVIGNIGLIATGAVNNTAGYLYGANVTSNSASFINTNAGLDKGMVGAYGDISLTANTIDNTNGQIGNALHGGGNTTLTASGNLTNAGGQIDSDQDLTVTANTIVGNGQVTAGHDAYINLQGNYTNATGNEFKAKNNLTVTTTGNFVNQADLKAVNTLTLNAANITNAGRIEGNTVEAHSNNFTNTETVMGDVINVYANNLNNLNANAVIGATQSINLTIANALNNQDGANILSLGDINIGSNLAIDPATGYLMGNAVSVTNQSATIESWGNMRISANTITNKRTLLTIGTNTWTGTPVVGVDSYNGSAGSPSYTPTFTQDYVAASTPEASLKVSGNAWFKANAINNEYSSVAIAGVETFSATLNQTALVLNNVETRNGVQNNFVNEVVGWHWSMCGGGGFPPSPPYPCKVNDYAWVNHPTYPSDTITTPVGYVNATHTAAVIKGDAGGVNNQTISSGAVGGTAATLGATLGSSQGSVSASNGSNTVTVPSSGLYTLHSQPGQNYLVTTDPRFTNYQNFVSSDYMLNRLSLDPLLIQKRLGDGFYEQKLILDQITELTGRRFLGQNASANEQYTALLDAGVEAAQELKLVPGVALTADQVDALTSNMVWLVDQIAELPDGTTQHVLAPKVYLTRVQLADLKPSGALIAADVIDIKITEKPQIAQAPEFGKITDGTAFRMPLPSGNMVKPQDGFVAINDGAMLYASNENSKIVTDGTVERLQIVLKDNVAVGDLEPGPAITGNKIAYESKPQLTSGALNNSGTIRANTSLSIDAKDISNRGGTISSGGSLDLNASNDILNQSGNINGGSVTLTAGRDIVSERLTDSTSSQQTQRTEMGGFGKVALNTIQQSSFTTTLIHGTAGITSTGTLDISAGRDVTLAGSNVNAGGDAAINAGRDLTVRTVTVQETASNDAISTSHTEQLASSITTGGNLMLASGNDMHLTSASLEVGKDATLAAGGDLTLDTSKNVDSVNVDTKTTKVRRYDETVLGTTLNAGGNVTLTATSVKTGETTGTAEPGADTNTGRADGKGNILLANATINSKGTLAVIADGNVDITSVDEKHETFQQTVTESNGFLSSTTTTRTKESSSSSAKGSNLSGTNVVVQAGDQDAKTGDITIKGSTIAATEVVSIDAGHDLNIVSAEDSASASSSEVKTTKGLTMGSSGPELGKNTTNTVTDGSTTQVSSTITGKNILTQSGNDTRISASNIQSKVDTTLYAGNNLYIESVANTLRHNQETTETKIGLNIAMMDGRLHDISVGTNGKITEDGNTSSTQVGSQIGSEGSVNILSGNSMLISASKLKAGTDMNLSAGGDILISGQYDQTTTEKSTATRMSSMKSKDKISDETQDYTFVGSSLDAGDNLNIKAGNNIDFTAAMLSSGADTNLTAEEGQIRFLTQKNIKIVSQTVDDEDLVYEVHKGKGSKDEALVYTQIKTGGKLNVDAAKGVVVEVDEVPAVPVAEETTDKDGNVIPATPALTTDPNIIPHPTFSASTAALVKQPGMEWMGQMLKRDDVDWQKAAVAHDHWDYKNQNLTEAGAIIVVVVVTYFTAGAASSAATSVTTATGSAAVGAAAGAAVTSLATTAALSFANNGGDLGKTLNDLGKKESIRGLLTAMVTAGVLQGLNSTLGIEKVNAKSSFGQQLGKNLIDNTASTVLNHAINGGDLQQMLEQSFKSAFIDTGAAQTAYKIGDMKGKELNNFTHKLAHAIAGCAVGVAKAGDCSSGALGAVVGELSAEFYAPESTAGMTQEQIDKMKIDTVNFAKIMASVAAAVTGGDAEAINLAASTGGNAAENNRLLHLDEQDRIKKLAKGDPEEEARLTAAACALTHCADGVPKDDPSYGYLKMLQETGSGMQDEMTLLSNQTEWNGQGWNRLFQYSKVDQYISDPASQSKLGTRAGGVLQAFAGSATAIGGGGLFAGGVATCLETGIGCFAVAGGGAMTVYGYDMTIAGTTTAYTGNPTLTYGEQVLQSLGMSPQAAGITYALVGLSPAITPAIQQAFMKAAPQIDASILNSQAKIGQNIDDIASSLATNSTHRAGTADRVVLGKWEGNYEGYVGDAKLNGGIWYQTDKGVWEKMTNGLTDAEKVTVAWKVNESFLKQQLQAGIPRFEFVGEPIVNTLANPAVASSFRVREIQYLSQEAPKWGYVREGNSWVKK
ncbi:MAG: DUF637 domain-containing protein [Gammaproteobacteria bacterium]|nr:DUF637 domain-containing protein [Gammaproteobacteria bacterium]MBU1482679.1 DUF637 domain-containing protein [Gammaproteobacteria bacterium]